jgi:hypothetical protein
MIKEYRWQLKYLICIEQQLQSHRQQLDWLRDQLDCIQTFMSEFD